MSDLPSLEGFEKGTPGGETFEVQLREDALEHTEEMRANIALYETRLKDMEAEGKLPENAQAYIPYNVIHNFKHKGKKLNAQRQLFVQEFMRTLSVKQAHQAAGYSGTSATTMTKDPGVRACIETCLDYRNARLGMDGDAVLLNLADMANASVGDIMEWDEKGIKMRNSNDVSHQAMRSIKKIEQRVLPNGTKSMSIEMHDALKANDMLARHLGMYKDKVDVSITHGEIDKVINESRARVLQSKRKKEFTNDNEPQYKHVPNGSILDD